MDWLLCSNRDKTANLVKIYYERNVLEKALMSPHGSLENVYSTKAFLQHHDSSIDFMLTVQQLYFALAVDIDVI